jgi:hypothetical protein
MNRMAYDMHSAVTAQYDIISAEKEKNRTLEKKVGVLSYWLLFSRNVMFVFFCSFHSNRCSP